MPVVSVEETSFHGYVLASVRLQREAPEWHQRNLALISLRLLFSLDGLDSAQRMIKLQQSLHLLRVRFRILAIVGRAEEGAKYDRTAEHDTFDVVRLADWLGGDGRGNCEKESCDGKVRDFHGNKEGLSLVVSIEQQDDHLWILFLRIKTPLPIYPILGKIYMSLPTATWLRHVKHVSIKEVTMFLMPGFLNTSGESLCP